MARYRYRTAALRGSWRDSRDQALRDAIEARQAIEDEDAAEGVRWLVPGDIEAEAQARPRRTA